MKRSALAMFVIVMVSGAGSGFVCAGPLSGGPKLGMNLTNLYGSDVEESGFKSGVCLGAFMTFNISSVFAIQPELLYTQKGDKYEDEDEFFGTLKAWTMLDYLEIPILAKFSIPTKGKVTPNLFFGPAVAFKTRSKGRLEIEGLSVEVDIEDVSGVDLGLALGAGVGIVAGPGEVVVDARYTLGLTSVDASEWDMDVKNAAISILVGYSFQPKPKILQKVR